MLQDEFRLFLSAVSSEFGKARDALAADLRSRELLLRVQSDFRQEPESDTTHVGATLNISSAVMSQKLRFPLDFKIARGSQDINFATSISASK